MNRTLLFIALLIPVFIIQLSSAYVNENPESSECIRCHKKIYNNALASPYRHTVAIDTCAACHITGSIDDKGPEEEEVGNKDAIHFSRIKRKGSFSLKAFRKTKHMSSPYP